MSVAAARAAYRRREWRTVYDSLSGERPALGTGDLELLAEAAWWLGESSASMATSEELYQRLRTSGEDQQAAHRALRLAAQWFARGDVQVATAWLARSRRLLHDLPRCATHGYLLYLESSLDMDLTGDPGPAAAACAEVAALGREFDDATLGSFALTLQGMSRIRSGETGAGFDDLDEAMLPVLAGRVDPLWAGDLHCTVIHLCDDLADLTRMRAWTQALARWSTPLSLTFIYAGVTRVHELQLVAAEGDYATVEAELGHESADLVGRHGWLAGEGYYTLGEVRRVRGDPDGARSAYSRARELGHDAQPGAALLAVGTQGREAALAQLRIALADQNRLQRARLLPEAVRLASEDGATAYAESLTAELEETAARYGTPGLRARASQARARMLLGSGEPATAVRLLQEAGQVYREQRHRYATAAVHEQLADAWLACGEPERAGAERATALAIYRDLGAAPDVARLLPGALPGGLTEREGEVLRLVAAGASNQDVATALTISVKTVSRHLANIFTKIGASSRTAAAAWARDHHV